VLVTGAAGMLGAALLPALAAAGHEVLGLDQADGDVTRLEAIERPAREFRPDWIAHLAAWTDVDGCERDEARAFLVNETGSRHAALAAAAAGAGVLAVSTDYVFDGATATPRREFDLPAPLNVYGRSKLAGERAARAANPRTIVVRTAWLYGPGGRNFVDTILAKAAAGEPLRVVDDQRGSPTATTDLAPALAALLALGEPGTFHVTNAGECSWHELACEACRLAGLPVAIGRLSTAELARPARRPAYSVLSNAWFARVTGRTLPHWRDALARHLARAGAATRKES
jgi:dTDP-4-dehydrorhamnose reductase